MIFLTVTKPKRKANVLLKVVFALLLLGVLMPSFYNLMQSANSLGRFAAKEEAFPGDPIRVEGEMFDFEELGAWEELKMVFQIK